MQIVNVFGITNVKQLDRFRAILRGKSDYLHIIIDKHLWSFSQQSLQSNLILRETNIVPIHKMFYENTCVILTAALTLS